MWNVLDKILRAVIVALCKLELYSVILSIT